MVVTMQLVHVLMGRATQGDHRAAGGHELMWKAMQGGHRAAGGHELMTMLVGPLCCSSDDLGWHIQEAPVALRDEFALKGFRGFTDGTTALWLPREWKRSSLEDLDLLPGTHHPSAIIRCSLLPG